MITLSTGALPPTHEQQHDRLTELILVPIKKSLFGESFINVYFDPIQQGIESSSNITFKSFYPYISPQRSFLHHWKAHLIVFLHIYLKAQRQMLEHILILFVFCFSAWRKLRFINYSSSEWNEDVLLANFLKEWSFSKRIHTKEKRSIHHVMAYSHDEQNWALRIQIRTNARIWQNCKQKQDWSSSMNIGSVCCIISSGFCGTSFTYWNMRYAVFVQSI